MIFFEANEMFRALGEAYDACAAEGPVSVDIATYGISLFDEKCAWGAVESRARRLMDRLRGKGADVRVLIGLPPAKKCDKADYGLREIKYRRRIAEALRIGEEYGICCLPTSQSHLKMYRINDLYVTGGINLGNSYWLDCSVALEDPDDKARLQEVFDAAWLGAATVRPIFDAAPDWLAERKRE